MEKRTLTIQRLQYLLRTGQTDNIIAYHDFKQKRGTWAIEVHHVIDLTLTSRVGEEESNLNFLDRSGVWSLPKLHPSKYLDRIQYNEDRLITLCEMTNYATV